MKSFKRRKFLSLLSSTVLIASLPIISGCQPLEPKAFSTGRTVLPPIGCTELLARDQQGDC